MQIEFFDEFDEKEKSFIETIVEGVSQEYVNALKNNFLFCAVLLDLHVEIFSTPNPTNGACNTKGAHFRKIVINVNKNDSEKQIAFIIAHEFAHLLFRNLTDLKRLSGRAMDGSTNYSAIMRILPDDTIYAQSLEESVCDYLAHFIVGRKDFDDSNNQYQETLNNSEFKNHVVRLLETSFGRSIYECDFIDELYEEDGFVKFNWFWNSILSYSFNNIIDSIDDNLGIGSFKEFCSLLDEYFCSSEKKEELEEFLKKF